MNDDLEGALKEYLKLMEAEEYFEAHEVLEEAWHPLRFKDHPLKNLLKALINAAVSFEHLKRDRQDAARKALRVMESYERHKGLYSDQIAFADLFKKACEKVEMLKREYSEIYEETS